MIYIRGGFYWYEFVFNGRRYRKTTDIRVGKGDRDNYGEIQGIKGW